MKKHTITFNHTISGKNQMIVVSAVGKVGDVKAMTLAGVGRLKKLEKRTFWIINLHFPFLHKREEVVGAKKLGK